MDVWKNIFHVADVCMGCPCVVFAVPFLGPPGGPKNGTAKGPSFRFPIQFKKRSRKWGRQTVPFLGPFLLSFSAVFQFWNGSKRFLFDWWFRTKQVNEQQLGRPHSAKPVLSQFSGARIGPTEGSCFVDVTGLGLCLLWPMVERWLGWSLTRLGHSLVFDRTLFWPNSLEFRNLSW